MGIDFLAYSQAGAAIFSAIAAIFSAVAAIAAYKILARQHQEEHRHITAYLFDFFRKGKNKVFYEVCYVNNASQPNTVKILELEIIIIDEKGNKSNILIPPHKTKKPTNNYFSFPVNIPPKSSASGMLVFTIPPLKKELSIVDYCLKAEDAEGRVIASPSHIMRTRDK